MKTAKARKPPKKDEEVEGLRQQLAESRAAFAALAAGQVDSITQTNGPVLLREAQEALHRSEANFRALIEQLPDQVWVHRGGRIIYVNPYALRCLGYQRVEEMVGHDLSEFVFPEDRQLLEGRIRAVTQVGQRADRYELRLRHRDGSVVVMEVSAQGVFFDGAQATLKVAHDVTERKKLEAHLQVADRMVSIGMLAAGVAHEINNPLSYVVANLGFVAQELAELVGSMPAQAVAFEQATVAIKDAQEGAERVRGIVRDLKTFSHSDDGRRGPVDVHRMLDSTVSMAWNEVRHRSRLVKDYARSPLMVEGNEARLGQVFLNLVVNAAQAITEGAADKNEIRLVTRPDRDGRVVIEVRDTGPGMTPEVLGRLFTPFFTTKPKGVGTGLGLSICQKIVSSHGGEIQVESKVGTGTTFRVWLPAATTAAAEVKTEPLRLPKGRRGRVLIVDDEPMLGTALRRMLAHHHDVEAVTSGKEALRRITEDGKFDVVFCDLMMPEMTGPEVYAAVAAAYPELAKRIVFLSGGAFTESAQTFLDRTPNLRIDKPFDVGQILSVVAQFVDGK